MKTRWIVGILLALLVAGMTPAWADPITITVPCEINHDQWLIFSREQWRYRSCSAALPALAQYGSVEITVSPIIQVAPTSHPGQAWACEYATPRWVNASAGLVVSATTDGKVVRLLAVNLRSADSLAETVTVGVQCY